MAHPKVHRQLGQAALHQGEGLCALCSQVLRQPSHCLPVQGAALGAALRVVPAAAGHAGSFT